MTAAIHNGRFYLLDVWRDRLSYPDLKRRILAHARAHEAHTLLIERAGPGIPLVQELVAEHHPGLPRPIGVPPEGDKIMRLEAASSVIERGDLLVPEEAPWLGAFLHELLGFPTSRHDDQVDALSQLIRWQVARARKRRRVSLAAPTLT